MIKGVNVIIIGIEIFNELFNCLYIIFVVKF